ncbi:hypothetical protein PQI64_12720 [Shewanella bicestrii]
MRSLIEKQAIALAAVGILKLNGCHVLTINTSHLTPVIDIDKPFERLRRKAAHITEVHRGIVNKICVATCQGCLVRWPDDGLDLPEQLTTTLNPYSPELISVWPKNF